MLPIDKKILDRTLIGKDIDFQNSKAQVMLDSIFGTNWQLGTIIKFYETFQYVKTIRISMVPESWSFHIKLGKVTSTCKFREQYWKQDALNNV